MSESELSQDAALLLKQLRAMPCIDAFDRDAAEELVARGLAIHIPATGSIEATEAGRGTAMAGTKSATEQKPLAADVISGIDAASQDDRLGSIRESGIPAMGEGIGVNGTAGSEGMSKTLKTSNAPAHH